MSRCMPLWGALIAISVALPSVAVSAAAIQHHGARERNKAELAKLKLPGTVHAKLSVAPHVAKDAVVRNAIGSAVPGKPLQAKAANAKVSAVSGLANTPKPGGVAATGDAAARPAGPQPRSQNAPPLVGRNGDPPISARLNPGVINGRDLNRSSAGAGAINGAARRIAAGIISGADFHPRHP